jgi:Predicted membrane protein (DUF2142)
LGAAKRDVAACLAVAVLVLAVGVAATLARAQPRRSGSNGARPSAVVATATGGRTLCQHGTTLPAGTASLHAQMTPGGAAGPALLVTARQGTRVLDRVPVAAGWRGIELVAPVARSARDYAGVDVCVSVTRGGGPVGAIGDRAAPGTGALTLDGRAVGAAMRIDWYRPGSESWWALAATVMTRIGRGHGGWGGPWVGWSALALALAAGGLAIGLAWRALTSERAVPRARWLVAAVATANALAWSLVTPVFLVPDEISHVAYVQQVAETGRPPVPRDPPVFSPELRAAMAAVRSGTTTRTVWRAKVWTAAEQRRLERLLDAPLPRVGNGSAGDVDPEPPLYYALQALPYRAGASGTLVTRVALMRLCSALLAGATALLAFLFARECLPSRPWAWTVGGLVVACVPMLGYVSGGVNPDALLFAVSAALFLCVARAFRRGLTRRLAVWTGIAIAAGLLAKLNFYGLLPGAAVALALAARRRERRWSLRMLALPAAALAIGLAPFVLMLLLDATVWDRSLVLLHSTSGAHDDHGGRLAQLSWLWQVYLPRLPGQRSAFDGYIGYELWWKSFFGKFGGLDVPFPSGAYRAGLAAFVALLALAARTLASNRRELLARRAELLGYALMAGSLLALIALVAVRGWAPGIGAAAQGRYLLPLLPLLAGLVALAVRGAGARLGRPLGALVVVAAIAWSVFGQLVVVAAFYA